MNETVKHTQSEEETAVTRVLKRIEKAEKMIDPQHDISVRELRTIKENSQDAYDAVYKGFLLGYMQGLQAAEKTGKVEGERKSIPLYVQTMEQPKEQPRTLKLQYAPRQVVAQEAKRLVYVREEQKEPEPKKFFIKREEEAEKEG